MSLPVILRENASDPEFWSAYFNEEVCEKDYSAYADPSIQHGFSICFDLPILRKYGLSLLRDHFLGGFFLESVGTTIAYNANDGHPFAYGLRWEEVDLFGRCLALRDAEWRHPGFLVLLLNLATPITSEDDAALAFPLLESAWRSLGLFSGRRLDILLGHYDHRGSGMAWRVQKPYGWVLENTHSRRRADRSGSFPFTQWNSFVAAVRRCYRRAVRLDWLTHRDDRVRRIARRLAETADWGASGVLADALQEANCNHPAILAALRSGDSVQAAWVLELLLREPVGRLIRQHFASTVRAVQATHRLEVQFPADVDQRMVTEFRRALLEQGVGRAYFSGGVCFPVPDGPIAEDAFETTIVGDLNAGLEVIRRVFAKYGPPAGTAIYSWADRRHLPVAPTSTSRKRARDR
jgi:hypothetical protein